MASQITQHFCVCPRDPSKPLGLCVSCGGWVLTEAPNTALLEIAAMDSLSERGCPVCGAADCDLDDLSERQQQAMRREHNQQP